jgi:N6-L-threonylcarbamoyladenine synthase
VKWNDREGFVFGRRATGSFDIRKLDGKKLSAGVNCKYLHQIGYPRSVLTERRERIPPMPEGIGLLRDFR